MKSSYICAFILLIIMVQGCERVTFEEYQRDDPQAIFDEAWTFADRHYSYFDLKGVDWDSVYNVYSPRIRPDMGQVELFDLLAEMFYLLKDGHVNLRSAFDRSRYWEWYLNAPENFDYSIIERYYFQDRQRYIGPFQAIIIDSIGYVYLSSFGSEFSSGHLDLLMQSFQNTKGMIVDVRNNGGGSGSRAKRWAERYITSSLTVGRERYKSGPGDNSFSPWKEEILEPYNSDPSSVHNYTKPVVVLANRKSYSATNFFVQYMSEMDQMTVIGDRTGGGAGTPKFTELANGWILRLSTTQFQNTAGRDIESGVPVDIEVNITEEDRAENEDTILEFAIDFLQ